MIRTTRIFIMLAIFSIAAVSIVIAEGPWFDMVNCDFCKNLTAEEGLMDHIKTWENHKISNGSLSLTVVENDYLEAYKRAMMNMQKVDERIKKGEQVKTCGMCAAMGELMMLGAKWDFIESDNVIIMTMTSNDPEIVVKIHAYIDRTNDEYSKMAAMEKMPAENKEQKK